MRFSARWKTTLVRHRMRRSQMNGTVHDGLGCVEESRGSASWKAGAPLADPSSSSSFFIAVASRDDRPRIDHRPKSRRVTSCAFCRSGLNR